MTDEYVRRLTEASENLVPQRQASLTRTKEEAAIRRITERFWSELEAGGITRAELGGRADPITWALESAIKEAMEV